MKETPQISEAEWEVMEVIWNHNPISANEVIDELQQKKWSPKTIKSLINRLVQKNALSYSQSGRAYFYTPLIDKKECMLTKSQSFLRRFYGGSIKPMVVHFIENEQLSDKDLEELRRILENKGKNNYAK
jgi:BlaI family penicillinase repressor